MRFLYFVAPVIAALAAACGEAGARPAAPGLAVGRSVPPAIPIPNDRQGSALTEYALLGKDTAARSSATQDDGNAAVILPFVGGPSLPQYALYRFNLAGPVDQLKASFGAGTGHAWVGVADYPAGRWRFSGPYDASVTLALDSAKVASPLGNVFVVVAAGPGAGARVEQVQLFHGNTPPSAAFSAAPESGRVPLDVLFDAGASSDAEANIVSYDWDMDGDGTYEIAGVPTPGIGYEFTGVGGHVVSLRVTDSTGLTDIASRTITVKPDLPPLAVLHASTAEGHAPLHVVLNAGDSSAPGGTISSFKWDIDGNGSFETNTGLTPTIEIDLGGGLHYMAVKVTDDSGKYDVALATVMAHGWRTTRVAEGTTYAPSLCAVNGKPAITFIKASEDGIRYAYSSLSDGSDDWHIVDVVTTWTGLQTSLAVINGCPAMSYSGSIGPLSYAWSTQPDGSGDWNHVDVDGPPNQYYGEANCLAEINGKPAISYRIGLMTTSLKYAYSSQPDGSGGWSSLYIANEPGHSYAGTALCELDGCPAIAYTDVTALEVRLARSTIADGSSGWLQQTVRNNSRGWQLAVVGGRPALTFRDAASQVPHYARNSAADGSGSWTISSIAGLDSYRCPLAQIQGQLCLLNIGSADTLLSNTALDGSAAWDTEPLPPTAGDADLAEIAEAPGIAYVAQDGLYFALLY